MGIKIAIWFFIFILRINQTLVWTDFSLVSASHQKIWLASRFNWLTERTLPKKWSFKLLYVLNGCGVKYHSQLFGKHAWIATIMYIILYFSIQWPKFKLKVFAYLVISSGWHRFYSWFFLLDFTFKKKAHIFCEYCLEFI